MGLAAVAVGGCSRSGAPGAAGAAVAEPAGPLCAQLPAGTDPGVPAQLATEPPDVVLQWMPVGTIFEAGVRAAGIGPELRTSDVTMLVPTDDAFTTALTQETIDELILTRHDDLRRLLEAHLIEGTYDVSDMASAGEVTTRSGDVITAAPADGGMVRLDGDVQTLCADYRIAGGRMHVIDGVLGELPAPAPTQPPAHG